MVLNATIPITNGSIKYNAKPSSFSEYHYSAVRKDRRIVARRIQIIPKDFIFYKHLFLSRGSIGNSLSIFTRFEYEGMQNIGLASRRPRSQAIRVLANPNASPRQQRSKKEVNMVDPVEAKRLAAKQMEEIKAKERLERRRQIEAINGAWAMIGLTAGLVIEGHTGLSIPAQLASYLAAVVGIFTR